jgi:hypothetical protein
MGRGGGDSALWSVYLVDPDGEVVFERLINPNADLGGAAAAAMAAGVMLDDLIAAPQSEEVGQQLRQAVEALAGPRRSIVAMTAEIAAALAVTDWPALHLS